MWHFFIPVIALAAWIYEIKKTKKHHHLASEESADPGYHRPTNPGAIRVEQKQWDRTNENRVDYSNPIFTDEYWEKRQQLAGRDEEINRWFPGNDPQDEYTRDTKTPLTVNAHFPSAYWRNYNPNEY
jgi:hypothetical protein